MKTSVENDISSSNFTETDKENQFGYRLTFISAPSDNETVNESEVPITWFSHFHYIYELIYVRKVIQLD